MNYKNIMTIVLLAWFIRPFTAGQEFTNQVVRAYKISNATSIDVLNKYGKIHVITWDNDSVKFVIDIRIRNKDEEKLNKIKKSISFEFTPAQYYVMVKTSIGDGSEDAFKDLKDIAGSYFSSQNQIMINYTIMVPGYSSLKLENKFGDVYLDDRDGNLNLILSYGNFKANNLNGNCTVRLSSGDVEINKIADGNLTLSYSNLHILKAENLSVDSRSSNVNIDEVNDLTLRSRRDKLILPSVGTLKGDSYFSEFSVIGLKQSLDYILRYGSLTIDNIERTFSSIAIASEYADIRLAFAKGSAFNVEINHHQDALLSYPRLMGTLNTKTADTGEKMKTSYGRLGSSQPVANVSISAPKKCIISLIQK